MNEVWIVACYQQRYHILLYIRLHHEKCDWSRTFSQLTIPCKLDMINAISVADIAFIMSSSTSAWLLSPLECPPQKQNGWTRRFCFWGWIMWKMYNTTIIEFGFRMISWIIKTSCLCYLGQLSASADNTDLGFGNSWYHAQPHPIIVYYKLKRPFGSEKALWIWKLILLLKRILLLHPLKSAL